MKYSRILIIALIFLASSGWREIYAQPRLAVVGGDTVNYGKHYVGEIHRSITIRNPGTDTLIIARIVPGNTRVFAQTAKKIIPPGDTTRMDIRVDYGSVLGFHKSNILIISNANVNDSTKIQVTETVKGRLAITKSEIDFPGCAIYQTVSPEFDLTNYDDTFVTVSAIVLPTDTSVGVLKLEDTRAFTLSPGTSRLLRFSFTPHRTGYM